MHVCSPHSSQAKFPLELLAPAGSPAAFYAALYAGADAIYCALGCDFNARRSADNFSDEDFQQACKDAHILGVHVYVPINIEMRTEEIPRVLALVERAWTLGADAFIIQDWGVLFEVRRRFPHIECHISTQSNIHDCRGIAFCRACGAQRVTLSRELSLSELTKLSKEGVDLECFGHGALCFCYSGLCMLSSLNGDRSANRGLCAQPCRLHYRMYDDEGHVYTLKKNDHLLCPKDYCVQDKLQDMAQAGVFSLKIEGRMKSPAYVYAVVRAYRLRMQALLEHRDLSHEEEQTIHNLLQRSFNRGFTHAYLDGTSGNEMMSFDRSNNRGQLVGSVVSSRDLGVFKRPRPDKPGRFRYKPTAEITVLLSCEVHKDDLLELREDGHSDFLTSRVTHDAQAGDTIICQTARPLPQGCPVRMIRSQELMDIADKAARHVLVRRVPVVFSIYAHLNEKFIITAQTADGRAAATLAGDPPQVAKTRTLTKEDIIAHVGRVGTSPFEVESFSIDMDEGLGMAFSTLHHLRQQVLEDLQHTLLEPTSQRARTEALRCMRKGLLFTQKPTMDTVATELAYGRQKNLLLGMRDSRVHEQLSSQLFYGAAICALVPSVEAAFTAIKAGATRLYATVDTLLYAKHHHQAWPAHHVPIPLLDEVCRERDHVRNDLFVQRDKSCAVGNMSELLLAHQSGAISEIRPCVPVFNTSTIEVLARYGASTIWFSPELSLRELIGLSKASPLCTGMLVLGRPRTMTTEHCILQAANQCIHNCLKCRLRQRRMWLESERGDKHAFTVDLEGRSRLYSAHPLDATPNIPALMEAGMNMFMVDCTLLSTEQIVQYIHHVQHAVLAGYNHKQPKPRMVGFSAGRLFDEVG
ncbi:DUF3656 domain-containing U32 family peptidase [Fannyhessea vaginae]|uniref:U32 family peptidase n=1 Tax=Fannyhessea vaginae TaxID=82135 RepID=UPI003B22206F